MLSKKRLLNFACFVAKEVMRDDFEDRAGAFAELACRKLHYLGLIKTDGEHWILEDERMADNG